LPRPPYQRLWRDAALDRLLARECAVLPFGQVSNDEVGLHDRQGWRQGATSSVTAGPIEPFLSRNRAGSWSDP